MKKNLENSHYCSLPIERDDTNAVNFFIRNQGVQKEVSFQVLKELSTKKIYLVKILFRSKSERNIIFD